MKTTEYDPNLRITTHLELVHKAAETNRVVVYPQRNELFCDFDRGHPGLNKGVLEKLADLHEEVDLPEINFGSPSGGYHCIVRLPIYATVETRLAWQAALGSDPLREAMAVYLWEHCEKRADDGAVIICLFESLANSTTIALWRAQHPQMV